MSWLIYKYEEPIYINICDWFNIGNIEVKYGILLDTLSMVVMVPVGIVTISVLIYALEYMKHDPNRNRFYIILSVFAIFMTILVISNNYIVMFIGWEFVGVISYLLISFWNTRITAMKSALSAILLNRMGDTLYVICIGIMLNLYNAVDFETIELLTPHMNTNILNIIAICLLIAATAKSAQLGLHGWLLHAMEGHCTRKSYNNKEINIGCKSIYLFKKYQNNLKTAESSNKGINNKNKSIHIYVYDIDTLEELSFNSKLECSKYFSMNRTTITKYINNNELFKYKYIFSDKKLDINIIINKRIDQNVWDIVTGEMLGDGHIRKENINDNGRLEFTFSSKILHYINYLKFNVLKSICNETPLTPWPKDNPTQYWFSSKNMPYITKLHSQWYKLNENINKAESDNVRKKYIKKLPDNIEELITPISLAHWLMGDGYFKNYEKTIFFCTDNFTKDEVLTLINILNDKFNIKSSLSKRSYLDKNNNTIINYRIRISKKDVNKLINLIKPYIIPQMFYKLGLSTNDFESINNFK